MFESAQARLDRVAAAVAARDAAELEMALALADAVEHQAFLAAGLAHETSWLRAYTESSGDDARRAVALGRFLAQHGATREAVERGVLSVGRVGVLAAAVTEARREAYRGDEQVLLAQIRRLSRVRDVEVLVDHWCDIVDQEAAPNADRAQRLYLQHRFDGGASVRGELDARTTEAVRVGLDAFDTGPDPATGPLPARSLAERRVDALGDMARCAVAGARPERDAAEPAQRSTRTTMLVVDAPSLAARGSTDLEVIVATLDGRPIAARAARDLLCDTWIAAVLTDATGAVIDASERSADFTDTQRRLVAARDRGCVFPGCDAPPPWCDVHHLHWKTDGGGRSLGNGVLLCRRHRTLLHRVARNGKRWALHRRPDGSWEATSPTGTTWAGRPAAASGAGREPPGQRRTAA